MKTKTEQINLAFKNIDSQKHELINLYGWDAALVTENTLLLKERAISEIHEWGDCEDLSCCWDLIHWIKKEKISFKHNFSQLKESNLNKYYHFLELSSELTHAFRFISSCTHDIEAYAGINLNHATEYIYAFKISNGPFHTCDINDIESAFEKYGAFKLAQSLYFQAI